MASNIIIKLPDKPEELLVTANLRASHTSTSPKPVLIVDLYIAPWTAHGFPGKLLTACGAGVQPGYLMCQARYAHILNKGTDSCLLSYSD